MRLDRIGFFVFDRGRAFLDLLPKVVRYNEGDRMRTGKEIGCKL